VSAWYSGVQVTDDAPGVSVSIYERIAGSTRITTAVEASKRAFPSGAGVNTAVVATAYGWPDALSASGLAGAVDGPLLLVTQNAVPAVVLDELNRLGITKVYLIGGTGVLGNGVWNDLVGFSRERLGGANRYATARLVAQEVLSITGDVDTAFVATGLNFADALAASSPSAGMGAPILLTLPTTLPGDTANALNSLNLDTIVVCGGTAVVSDSVKNAMNPYASSVIRKGGSNRYGTAKLILEWAQTQLVPSGPEGIFLATGKNYPDALAGGVLAARADGQWRPLMLTDPNTLSLEAAQYMQANSKIGHAGVLGGTGAVSNTVLNSAKAQLP
jgi:putative cell wall-binding protein